jgi:hypothetical protein
VQGVPGQEMLGAASSSSSDAASDCWAGSSQQSPAVQKVRKETQLL